MDSIISLLSSLANPKGILIVLGVAFLLFIAAMKIGMKGTKKSYYDDDD
ncbi:MAG: hypothetical protein ACM3PP_08635 [Candidatus Saccharibacteria bacterium]